jgi:flagellar motor component MotA
MSSQYGTIFDKSNIKKQLINANRDYTGRKTWENLYSSVDLARRQQVNSLQRDYSQAISDAYSAAYLANQSISASNLGEGYKLKAMSDTDLALEQAYESYRQNYLQGLSQVETSASEAYSQIDEKLDEQAGYMKQFADAPYDYLQYLFDKYSEGEEQDNIFLNDPLWNRYTYQDDATGELMLKSWEDIAAYGAHDEYTDSFGNVRKEWTGLFDESGNLTIKGADYYDQLLNYHAAKGSNLSFGKWLHETNEDLYNWSTSYNPYDYNSSGTNIGSFNTMVGLTSADQQYSFIERFGGMSRKELNSMYSSFTDKIAELNNKVNNSSGRDSKELLSTYESLTNEIKTITDRLGITKDIENEMNMSLDELAEYMSDLTSKSLSNGEIWWEGIKTVGVTSGAAAITGAQAASVIPGAGTALGAVGGAIVGAIAGTAEAIRMSNTFKTQNKDFADTGKDLYNNLVNTLVSYSHSKQRQSQKDFYRLNK